MEGVIDIQLVKEQLRLLGHDVADEVILEFVKGLNKGPGISQLPSALGSTDTAASECDAGSRDAKAPSAPNSQLPGALNSSSKLGVASAGPHDVAWRAQGDTDAAPSKLQQAPDQQSPKRLTGAGSAAQSQRHSPPAQALTQRAALDQRCRNFLSRCSDKPSSPQQQQPQQQRPILLQVPQLHHRSAAAARSGGDGGSSQQSSSGSSELLLDYIGSDSDDADSGDGGAHGLGQLQHSAQQRHPARALHDPAAAAGWAQLPAQRSQPQQTHMQTWLGGGGSAQDDSCGRDSNTGADSDSDDSSMCLEAEGSKFLLHQAATMQRVRARLAAKMAGYTASAAAASGANSSEGPLPQAQLQQQQARPGSRSSSTHAAVAAAAVMPSSSGRGGMEEPSAQGGELPRFGFRPGYKPVGIHMPPPPSSAAVEALTAARALRQQAATAAAPAPAPGTLAAAGPGARAAVVPKLQLGGGDMPLHMRSLASAVDSLQQQQHTQAHWRPDSLLVPAVGMGGSCGHVPLVASPGKAVCAGGAGARSSGSIIGGEVSPCMPAGSSKPRHSPRVDPLYLAPSSPRRSNPATPRSSPACSPAPLAPLSATAVGLSLRRSPAGTAPAAAAAAGRSSRQSVPSSAGSNRADSGRTSSQGLLQQQQHQRDGTAGAAGVRRVSSAPPTPSAQAPSTAVRSAGSGAGAGSYSARRSTSSSGGVSHESLYCQRLAYSSQRATVAPGVRKTDRVARFQQMQQQWARDSFLRSGAGGAAAKKSGGQQGYV